MAEGRSGARRETGDARRRRPARRNVHHGATDRPVTPGSSAVAADGVVCACGVPLPAMADRPHAHPGQDDHPDPATAQQVDGALADPVHAAPAVPHLPAQHGGGEIGAFHLEVPPFASKVLASAPCPMPFVRTRVPGPADAHRRPAPRHSPHGPPPGRRRGLRAQPSCRPRPAVLRAQHGHRFLGRVRVGDDPPSASQRSAPYASGTPRGRGPLRPAPGPRLRPPDPRGQGRGAFVGGDLLVRAVTRGPAEEQPPGNFPEYQLLP